MELETRDALLTAGVSVGFLVGVGLVLLGGATAATVGILLVTLSAVAFVADAKDLLVLSDRNARE